MDNARVRFYRRLAMDRESSRLYREARRAQRQLRGPAGVAAAAELGRAAAQAASGERTGAARDAQRNALRATAALGAGYRPSSVSNGAKSNFAEFNTPSALPQSAAPAVPDAANPTSSAFVGPPTSAATPTAKPVASGTPLAAPEQAPPLLRRLALTSGAINGETLLTKEGAIQRVITESAGGAATRSDVLDKINSEREALGQDPIAIDWAKDVASRDIASADRRTAEAAKDGGNRAAGGYLDSTTFRGMAKPAATPPPAAPKQVLPDSWPATPEERRTAAASSSAAKAGAAAPTAPPVGLGAAVAADAAKLKADASWAVQNTKGVLAKSAVISASAIRDAARNAAATLTKGATLPVKAIGGATGKELRKLRKQAADSVYNRL